jgi:hypothetical protein
MTIKTESTRLDEAYSEARTPGVPTGRVVAVDRLKITKCLLIASVAAAARHVVLDVVLLVEIRRADAAVV